MLEVKTPDKSSPLFLLAVAAIERANLRPELVVRQIDAPKGLAENAIAFTAEVEHSADHSHTSPGTGRFVLLWDPKPQEAWTGNFRIVCFVKSSLEVHIAGDERIADVALAWLSDALRNNRAVGESAAGTTTRIVSSGFGTLAAEPDHGELELRASWSPTDDNFAGHFSAWQDLICVMAGFSPHADGVSQI